MATDGETCNAKTTIIIGDLTEADVECGKEPHGEEDETHVAIQHTIQKEGGGYARIAFIWS